MIARVWRCIATNENVPHYVEHFEKSVFPALKQLNGFKEAYILRRNVDDGVEITVMTLWESMDAIRSFAGEALDNAVVEPEAQAVLKSFDKTVMHHEVSLNIGK
jgi:heme-degrading monooxygenase HmoA